MATTLLAAACTAAPPAEPPAPQPPEIQSFETRGGPFSDPAVVPFAWTVNDANGDELTCKLDVETDGIWELTMSPCQWDGSRNSTTGAGSFVATLEVSDPAHPPVTATTAYSVGAGPTEPYDIDARIVTAPDQRLSDAIDTAVTRWEGVIARGVPDVTVNDPYCWVPPSITEDVDDIVINVAASELTGYFGTAAPCFSGPDGLPRLSGIRISTYVIENWPADRLADLLAHEIGHALGFAAPNWWAFLVGLGTDELHWTGPRGVAEWSALGGDGAIPMEPRNPGHWAEAQFRTELMTCGINAPPLPLSAMTIAAMADSGYHVNLAAADPFTLPPPPLGNVHC